MNKKTMGLIITIFIIGSVVPGAYYFLTPQYKVFNDNNIQVEIPVDAYFKVIENNSGNLKTLTYKEFFPDENRNEIPISEILFNRISPNTYIVEPLKSIKIKSINNGSNAFDLYNFTKNNTKEILKNYTIIDKSEHNYKSNVYDANKRGDISIYTIVLFDDTNMTIIRFSSSDLDTVVHMAETFKFKK
jgi:hypothetical protein